MLKDSQIKAVIFTHFGDLKYIDDFIQNKQKYIIRYSEKIKSYIQCNKEGKNIAILYVYVDWAMQQIVKSIDIKDETFHIDPLVMAQEIELLDVLKIAERLARSEMGGTKDFRIHYIGLSALIHLLNNIIETDKELLSLLCGRDGTFSYDSPKFIESVIRIARGRSPHLAANPVIRLDEDIEINPAAIDSLIKHYASLIRYNNFFFFSGCYGNPENTTYDPLNDHAVRVHWFFPSGKIPIEGYSEEQISKVKNFLADLSVLGATQIENSEAYFSVRVKELIKRKKISTIRQTPQVISGAGLMMSNTAIGFLPPFMNFSTHVTWIDDYLKRRLHEAIGDINKGDIESLKEARIMQVRHHGVIKEVDHKWAVEKYFERILSGCLHKSMMIDYDENPTSYSNLINNIVKFKIETKELLDQEIDKLKPELQSILEEKYDDVLYCMQSDEYKGSLSYEWALSKEKDNIYKNNFTEKILCDATEYAYLVFKWPVFVRAIERLPVLGNTWLFSE